MNDLFCELVKGLVITSLCKIREYRRSAGESFAVVDSAVSQLHSPHLSTVEVVSRLANLQDDDPLFQLTAVNCLTEILQIAKQLGQLESVDLIEKVALQTLLKKRPSKETLAFYCLRKLQLLRVLATGSEVSVELFKEVVQHYDSVLSVDNSLVKDQFRLSFTGAMTHFLVGLTGRQGPCSLARLLLEYVCGKALDCAGKPEEKEQRLKTSAYFLTLCTHLTAILLKAPAQYWHLVEEYSALLAIKLCESESLVIQQAANALGGLILFSALETNFVKHALVAHLAIRKLRVERGKDSSLVAALALVEKLVVEEKVLQSLTFNYDCMFVQNNVVEGLVKRFRALYKEQKWSQRLSSLVELFGRWAPQPLSPEQQLQLQAFQRRQQELQALTESFNEKPKQVFARLQVEESEAAQDWLVKFLKVNKKVSERKMVEALGDNKRINELLLQKYVLSFDYRGLGLLDCMRVFFKDFLLNGEGQQVNRVAENLTKFLFESKFGPDPQDGQLFRLDSWDLVHYFAISYLMLNTDIHNSLNLEKMKFESFRRLFEEYRPPPEYLELNYNSIRAAKIQCFRDIADLDRVSASVWRQFLREDALQLRVLFPQLRPDAAVARHLARSKLQQQLAAMLGEFVREELQQARRRDSTDLLELVEFKLGLMLQWQQFEQLSAVLGYCLAQVDYSKISSYDQLFNYGCLLTLLQVAVMLPEQEAHAEPLVAALVSSYGLRSSAMQDEALFLDFTQFYGKVLSSTERFVEESRPKSGLFEKLVNYLEGSSTKELQIAADPRRFNPALVASVRKCIPKSAFAQLLHKLSKSRRLDRQVAGFLSVLGKINILKCTTQFLSAFYLLCQLVSESEQLTAELLLQAYPLLREVTEPNPNIKGFMHHQFHIFCCFLTLRLLMFLLPKFDGPTPELGELLSKCTNCLLKCKDDLLTEVIMLSSQTLSSLSPAQQSAFQPQFARLTLALRKRVYTLDAPQLKQSLRQFQCQFGLNPDKHSLPAAQQPLPKDTESQQPLLSEPQKSDSKRQNQQQPINQKEAIPPDSRQQLQEVPQAQTHPEEKPAFKSQKEQIEQQGGEQSPSAEHNGA